MEHNGRTFTLARIDRGKFDHGAQTGFALTGKHRAQKCEACHTAAHIAAAARAEIRVKDPNHTFLGLRRECTGCHEDHHRGQLGNDCARCHSQEAWKPPTGFDHTRARFVLTGLHQKVPCQKCHGPKPGEAVARYQGLAFNGCQNCHNDPHRGAFQEAKVQGTCDRCHDTGGFKNNRSSAVFNHSMTKFPLVGKHTELACEKCHKSTDFKRPVAHARCQDCHQDPHRGQFAARAAGSDCGSCHAETGFKPAKFDRTAHAATAFPLKGKHLELRCVECHKPEGRDAVFKTGKLTCAECHTDQHGGEFAGAPWNNQCGSCHDESGFRPSKFTPARHAEGKFPLTGAHARVACEKCHKPMADAKANGQPRQYHFASRACTTCHENRHQTKVACDTCHTTEAWKATLEFNHSSTNFKLEGAHQTLKCAQCHTDIVFSKATARCASCHAAKDPHRGQFATGDRAEDCSACHVPVKWDGGAFSHERARFTLDVAHRNVACVKCHKLVDQMRVYRGTPRECIQCH